MQNPFNQQQASKEDSKSVFLHSAWQISEGQGFVLPWQQQIASPLPEAAQGPCRLCSTVSGYDVIAVAGETYNPAARLMGNREVSFPTILLLTVYTTKIPPLLDYMNSMNNWNLKEWLVAGFLFKNLLNSSPLPPEIECLST